MKLPCFAALWPSILHLILFVSTTKTVSCTINFGNETDRIALLAFKTQISSDPNGIFNSWNDSVDFCKWEGVTCGHKHKRVASLDLQGLSLMGTLSPHISNLTFLRSINLANNNFHGQIPQEVGSLFRLGYLNLTTNTFEGEIPANISYCSNLTIIDLSRNNLAGKIPTAISSLKKLVALCLHTNKLTGEIPHSIGNISSLQRFSLIGNHLQGNIPNNLGRLTRLTFFQVGDNNLTGTIPSTLYNLSSLTHFYVSANKLEGSLPPDIGLTLPNLLGFIVAGNQITGNIPISFTNASQLGLLEISYNKITGQVPNNLAYLKSLWWLNMEFNFLGHNTSRDLDFMTSLSNCSNLRLFSIAANNFGGMLLSSIGNMSDIQSLNIGRNQINGRIPTDVGNLVNLYKLDMRDNGFSGPIPDDLGKLVNLQMLGLAKNQLSGEIPQSLCNITHLFELTLYKNKLEGNLTTCIGNWKSLLRLYVSSNNLIGSIPYQISDLFPIQFLDLSQNALVGLIPSEMGSLKNILGINLSKNRLLGEIPKTIGDCSSLESLLLEDNMLQGDIPSSLASLKGLQELDLSGNNLSGNIPRDLEKLMFLQYLNLSFNNLKGEVPKEGVFSNVSAFSIDGNSDLCGGIPELQLPACHATGKKHKMPTVANILGAIISPILIFIVMTSLYVSHQRKSTKNPSPELFDAKMLPVISYKELLKATNGFSSDNIIGEGSFGCVYRGNLHTQGETLVAIKVLKLQQHGASKSFLAECKALCNIRHRNLVKVLTCCSSIDSRGNDFKALVFDFMENGSLEMWLHPVEDGSSRSKNLSLLQRLQVAIDVSSALHYLHDNCETPIVHCDMKPSNILFDNDLVAHVGDFGLARILSEPNNDASQGETSSVGIKGTIGYMAPEYGVGTQATKLGDVYSFGIILLEIFTGRRPTDQIFRDGLNLNNFVKSNLPGRVMQVLDPLLITTGDVAALTTSTVMEEDGDALVESLGQDGEEIYKCVLSILKIGLACSSELPADRMHMGDVNRKLNVITETFLNTRKRGRKPTMPH